MLSETDVIDAVCKKLESLGYKIRQRAKTTERGIDIIAAKEGALPIELYVEAKGETSSKSGTARHGKKFESADMQINVAEAFYKAVAVLSLKAGHDQVMAGIAFPDNKEYRKYVHVIEPVLNQLGIAVFWVQQKGVVELVSS
jgi:hypothetical protein